MRVTTERAQSAIKAHHITGNLTNIVKDYATDLLEARAIIEKQTASIKEMRDTLLAISQRNISFVCEDVRQMALEQWNKTNDYA